LIGVGSDFTAYVVFHFFSQKILALRHRFSERKEEKKPFKQQKSSSHQLRKRGHLGRRAPSPEKKKAVSEDQEGCGQASQQTSPDKLEDEENAEENVWSAQAHEHNAQNEHEA